MIGEASDPIPGDPEEVARLGRELRKTADAIKKQADEIKALSSVEEWKSKAAEEFRKEADEAEGKLRKAFKRYDAAADALGEKVKVDAGYSKEYASELHRAQAMADKALRAAQDAHDEHKASSSAIDRLPKDAPDDDPDRKRLERRQEEAASALERAKRSLEAAKDVRDGAAARARECIRHAIDNDGLKDGTWDKFKDWVHDRAAGLQKLLDGLGWVATICGTLSLMVGWIPVIGQALAGLLGTIALTATLLSLIGHVLLALAGEGSWFDVALDVVGLATLGIGRGALAGAKGAMEAAGALARSAAYRQVMEGVTAKVGSAAYKRAQTEAWKVANQLSGGTMRGKAAAEAMAHAPKGWFPGASRLGEAFSPKAIAKEWFDGLKGVKEFRPSNVRDLFRSSTWEGASFKVGDSGLDTLTQKIDDIAPQVREVDEVRAALDTFQTQTHIWQGTTAAATFIDAADKKQITAPVGDALGTDALDDGLWGATGIKDAWTTSNG
ncbi:putative T7SS-secreted protein [Streptomyces sp. enrichment culture]|uniref:putative T7SS-secreted protein n=1 Tax=Streptomyces sp. enrichment culture TaxID=1795815 RepID=UPI003F54CB2D